MERNAREGNDATGKEGVWEKGEYGEDSGEGGKADTKAKAKAEESSAGSRPQGGYETRRGEAAGN